jgi:HJR/Mrr/RecB family endonuclease
MARPSAFRGRLYLVGFGLLFCSLVWIQERTGISLRTSLTTLAVAGVVVFIGRKLMAARRWRTLRISQVDGMTGPEFERYLARLLTHQGYQVKLTGASGDLGVDMIASRKDQTLAIQAKRQAGKVSRRAVSDAVAGMAHYHCNASMVITNNYFSPGAVELAKSTDCRLVDRGELSGWIRNFQARPGVIFLPRPFSKP